MKNLFNPKVYKDILGVFIILLLIKVLWVILELGWLPSTDIDQIKENRNKSLYYRIKLTPNEASAPKKTIAKPIKHIVGSMKDITLLAIYNASDATVVTIVYKNKTKVLARGEEIQGFILEDAGMNFATFSKNAKTYKIMLVKDKQSIGSISVASPVKSLSKVQSKKVIEGDIVDAGDHKIIDRALLEHYATDMKDIYNNIGISEIRKGKDLEGFRITFVKRGTPFAKLGVRRGDVIKSINGQEINSYNAALNIYKNIQSMNNLTLVIERGKKEMELEYEIN